MDGQDLSAWVTLGLAAAALAWAGWVCLPELLKLTGLYRFGNGVLAGPEGVELEKLPEGHAALGRQLLDLGFAPLGVCWESDDIRRRFTEYLFASDREGCYAVLYGLFGNDPRVSFITAFEDGGQVHTKNFAHGVEADEEALKADGVATSELMRVLHRHRRAVGEFVAAGRRPRGGRSLDDYLSVSRDYYFFPNNYPSFRRDWEGTLRKKLVLLGLSFAVPFFSLGRDATRPGPWLGLMVGCLVCVGLYRLKRALLAQLATAEQNAPLGGENDS